MAGRPPSPSTTSRCGRPAPTADGGWPSTAPTGPLRCRLRRPDPDLDSERAGPVHGLPKSGSCSITTRVTDPAAAEEGTPDRLVNDSLPPGSFGALLRA